MSFYHNQLIMPYEDREALKESAWDVLRDTRIADEHKQSAVLGLIDAYYWRARECLEQAPYPFRKAVFGKHAGRSMKLSIDRYTEHWLSSNGDRVLGSLMESVLKFSGYKKVAHPMMPPGYSMYVDVVAERIR